MSGFGSKRRVRVIHVDEDDSASGPGLGANSGPADDGSSRPLFVPKSERKSFRQSGLRQATNTAEGDESSRINQSDAAEDDGDGPAVVRPLFNRSGTSKFKKKTKKPSKLSFGAGDDQEEESNSTPKKPTLGRRALENHALKHGSGMKGTPLRTFGDEDEKPRYSKEYLEELQSSTPNTPTNLGVSIGDPDEMELDSSELEGVTIVEPMKGSGPIQGTTILTDAEIQERKERRARLAKEENFLSLDDDADDAYRRTSKKHDTRLVADDQDVAEGFENFVDDGGVSLGRKAERDRRKRDKQHMADLITQAEGNSSDDSSDSDAGRRMAYEAAQTRAGMDGLKKPKKDPNEDLPQAPPKISPLRNLNECLSRLQNSLRTMEIDLNTKTARVEQLKKEKDDIVKREAEVQTLLNETGTQYREALRGRENEDGPISTSATLAELAGERGLESMGTTPARHADGVDDFP